MELENARVRDQTAIQGAYRLLVLDSPRIAGQAKPGQFVHLRVPNLDGSVLRRPFSVYRTDGAALSIVYKTVGRGTSVMEALRAGDIVSLLGPLGNGFPLRAPEGVPALVGGGYGIAALYLLARDLPARGILFAGGAFRNDILLVEEFKAAGWEARIATEDGSLGQRGQVTDVLDSWLTTERGTRSVEIYACGPMGMLRAVSERAIAGGWRAWLSLDRHMGCGVGVCLGCVQAIRTAAGDRTGRGAGVTWARVCTDGPVFESRQIVWD
jgi:dihydroorotate dehydrogenase electron transfer subunit